MEYTNMVVKKYTNMVGGIAWKYTKDPNLIDDLMQEGYIGLGLACEKYDKEKGSSFTTYAYIKISEMMQRYLRYKANLVHIPKTKDMNIIQTTLSDDKIADMEEQIFSTYDLEVALCSIDSKMAYIIRQHYYYGIPKIALANIAGMSYSKLKTKFNDSILELKQILEG